MLAGPSNKLREGELAAALAFPRTRLMQLAERIRSAKLGRDEDMLREWAPYSGSE